MTQPKGLDLFCGGGGASMGYHRAGFEMTGVDIALQKNYPFTFIQGDALEYVKEYGHEYDFIAASPPCQAYSWATQRWVNEGREYVNLIPPVRDILETLNRPYIIENVRNAPLITPIELEGTMFPELRVFKARRFESNMHLTPPSEKFRLNARIGFEDTDFVTVAGHGGDGTGRYAAWCDAMQIYWMTTKEELKEAIPPHYTHWLGAQVMEHLGLTPLSWPLVRAEQLRLVL